MMNIKAANGKQIRYLTIVQNPKTGERGQVVSTTSTITGAVRVLWFKSNTTAAVMPSQLYSVNG